MKKGFNRFSQGQNEEQSNESNQANQQQYQSLVPALPLQFLSYPPLSESENQNLIISLFQIVEQQSLTLQNLLGKVEQITKKSIELTQKVKELRMSKHQIEGDHFEEEKIKVQGIKGNADVVDSASLLKILFGPNKTYQYRLRLAEQLQLPLYRQRNFFLQLELVDLNETRVKNLNKIPLSLALYSSENPPKFIEKNTAGQKILKGYVEQSLVQGVCRFEKIQVREVTSHFRNGWVFIAIIPCMTPLGGAHGQGCVDYEQIEPLVLQKVIVKAKKLKQGKKQEGKKQQDICFDQNL